MITGTELAWETLAALTPDEIYANALVSCDTVSNAYALQLFHFTVSILPQSRRLLFPATGNDVLLEKLGSLPELHVISYLTNARDIPLSGELVKTAYITGGQIYSKGTHVLPLSALAGTYESAIEEFIRRGKALGGEELDYGDASVRLYPFPRIPVVLILWKGNNEVPSNASLLFDSTCEFHLPADILCSTAMMCVQILLKHGHAHYSHLFFNDDMGKTGPAYPHGNPMFYPEFDS